MRGVALDKTSNCSGCRLTIFKKLLDFESFLNSEQLVFYFIFFFAFFKCIVLIYFDQRAT